MPEARTTSRDGALGGTRSGCCTRRSLVGGRASLVASGARRGVVVDRRRMRSPPGRAGRRIGLGRLGRGVAETGIGVVGASLVDGGRVRARPRVRLRVSSSSAFSSSSYVCARTSASAQPAASGSGSTSHVGSSTSSSSTRARPSRPRSCSAACRIRPTLIVDARPPLRRTRHPTGHHHRHRTNREEPQEDRGPEGGLIHPDIAEVTQRATAGEAEHHHRQRGQPPTDRRPSPTPAPTAAAVVHTAGRPPRRRPPR